MEIFDREKLIKSTEETIEKLGYKSVEINFSQNQNNVKIRAVVYSVEGISLNDCEIIHKTLFPKLELLLDEKNNLSLEITSPGIDRVLKSCKEYQVFENKRIKILPKDKNEWLSGVISKTENQKIFIDLDNGSRLEIDYQDIQKGKLDY